MYVCDEPRSSSKKGREETVELPYYELERLYSGTPAGRAFLSDLVANGKWKPHPDKKARTCREL